MTDSNSHKTFILGKIIKIELQYVYLEKKISSWQ
jgi:hypothetical protein